MYYVQTLEACSMYTKSEKEWKAGEGYFGGSYAAVPGEPRQKVLRAISVDDGKILWEVNLGSEISGYPVTFSVKGKQYVAVSTGTSLVSSSVNLLVDLHPTKVNAIYVFALP